MEINKWCFKCGAKLKVSGTGAENFYFWSASGRIFMYQKYNTETGKRQIVSTITCPYFKKKWGFSNGHQDGFIDDLRDID